MKTVARHRLVSFYVKKIKILWIIFIAALKCYDKPCSPMDTTDDVNILPEPLPVNPSDQSEIAHGTPQPEPQNESSARELVLYDGEGTLPEYVYWISFKFFKFCILNFSVSVRILHRKHQISNSNQVHIHHVHHQVVRIVYLIRHKLKSVCLL